MDGDGGAVVGRDPRGIHLDRSADRHVKKAPFVHFGVGSGKKRKLIPVLVRQIQQIPDDDPGRTCAVKRQVACGARPLSFPLSSYSGCVRHSLSATTPSGTPILALTASISWQPQWSLACGKGRFEFKDERLDIAGPCLKDDILDWMRRHVRCRSSHHVTG